jgi:competence protein ComEA
MLIRKIAKDYLSFGKRDRIGILAVLALILIIYLIPRFYSGSSKELSIKESALIQQSIDSLASKDPAPEDDNSRYPRQKNMPQRPITAELFSFDPNTLGGEGWRRLGLSEKTSRTIEKYRQKGGRFYKAEDLRKIWGLPAGFYERVKDHIIIGPLEKPVAHEYQSFSKKVGENINRPALININEADTILLDALPGIGMKLAARILNFRDRLGGFYSVDQVAETYGLPDSTFQKIKTRLFVGDNPVRKININLATKEDLKTHPYFKWTLANAIVEYRTQHGDYKSVDELKKISIIDEVTFKKLFPYISL